MPAKTILTIASLAVVALMAAGTARAEGGGGGGDGNERLSEAAAALARPGARPGARFGGYAETTLPDGTRIRSRGLTTGDRAVTTRTPTGVVTQGVRPKGQKADQKGAVSRTVYNRETGITSTFTRYADGSTIGVHVDRYGNRSTSTSKLR